MLKLKKIQILGFKSFCDRSELLFPGNGTIGIVGPNGCGKSNIADAISWVLGEQSTKNLRSQRMEDVIFSGTRDRPATGMAEVSMTLVDPEVFNGPDDLEDPAIEVEDEWEEVDSSADAEISEAAESASGSEGQTGGDSNAGAAGAPEGAVVLTIRKRRKFVANNRPGEVVVTRRLFRNGNSEYLMNGRPCRLRDIQELFMGTGLGPESYAIIEQGRIGQILSSKPYDRRALIEEAAGVTKYKAKKKLAEAKLESARQNLARINDIFEEVTRQLGTLKRQAAKARRYAELKQEFDALQRRLLACRAAALEAEQARISEEHAQVCASAEQQQAQVDEKEAARAERRERLASVEQELRALTENIGRLAMEVDRTERQIAFNASQTIELAQRIENSGRDVERITLQQQQLEQELAASEAELAVTAEELQTAGEVCTRERAQCDTQTRNVNELEQQSRNARQRILSLIGEASRRGNEIAQGEATLASLDRQLARVEQEQQTAVTELDSVGVRRGQIGLEFQGRQEEQQAVEAEIRELEARIQQLKNDEVLARKQIDEARRELAQVAGRSRSLQEIVAHHGYSTQAVQKLFGNHEQFRPLGVLADFLEVEPAYERVVEEFLRDELNYVVVKSWDDADAGLGLLQQDKQGRATFLVHPEDGQFRMFEVRQGELQAQGGGSEPVALKSCVKVLNGFGQTLEHILPKLGSGYILRDPDAARTLAHQNPQAYFLTASGECFHNQTVTGGTRSGSGPLSLKRELRDLSRRESELSEVVSGHENRLAILVKELSIAQQQITNARARKVEIEKQIFTAGQAMKQLEGELNRIQQRMQVYTLELERGRQERLQNQERLGRLHEDRERLEVEKAAVEAEEVQTTAAINDARAAREEAGRKLAEAQSQLARLEERARTAQEARSRLLRSREELARSLAQVEAEVERARAQREQIVNSEAGLQAALQQAREQRESAQAQRAQLEEELANSRALGEQIEAEIKDARAALDGVRKQQNELELALARLASEAQFLAETCRNELSCELADLLNDPALTEASSEDTAAMTESVRQLRTKIDNLGPVNMMALEEFEETQQRHVFLETQRKDLLDSIADTQAAIQEIDTISRQQFNEAFEKINEYFQESFKVLFGGGQGFLKLTDIENNPEAGVDIVAQPPGKKLQNALLLSGGEKAMTAMALLFSIFRYQPSPFCVLDEVDAPLDESNVGRFSAMVRTMSEQTQFIIITHNKRTMEIASLLYGVTMQQPGCSKLVSVRVEEKPKAMARGA